MCRCLATSVFETSQVNTTGFMWKEVFWKLLDKIAIKIISKNSGSYVHQCNYLQHRWPLPQLRGPFPLVCASVSAIQHYRNRLDQQFSTFRYSLENDHWQLTWYFAYPLEGLTYSQGYAYPRLRTATLHLKHYLAKFTIRISSCCRFLNIFHRFSEPESVLHFESAVLFFVFLLILRFGYFVNVFVIADY